MHTRRCLSGTVIGSEVSLGYHEAGRAPAVLDAVRTGLIGPLTARAALPHLTDAEFALEAGGGEPKKLGAPHG